MYISACLDRPVITGNVSNNETVEFVRNKMFEKRRFTRASSWPMGVFRVVFGAYRTAVTKSAPSVVRFRHHAAVKRRNGPRRVIARFLFGKKPPNGPEKLRGVWPVRVSKRSDHNTHTHAREPADGMRVVVF